VFWLQGGEELCRQLKRMMTIQLDKKFQTKEDKVQVESSLNLPTEKGESAILGEHSS
jgi:hypothetical protein